MEYIGRIEGLPQLAVLINGRPLRRVTDRAELEVEGKVSGRFALVHMIGTDLFHVIGSLGN